MLKEYSSALDALERDGLLRSFPTRRACDVIDLTSNDYLGIAARRDIQREFIESCGCDLPSFTSAASRLLASAQGEYYALEQVLADAYGRPALLFNSGYHANTGLIPALAVKGTLVVADRLVHASIIDGIRLSRAPFRRFPHNDMTALNEILEKESTEFDRVLVVAESVYSMDGDISPLKEMVALKSQYKNVMIYLDEAHGIGAFGPTGLGVAEREGMLDEIDILVGTFGKALASEGAFAVMPDVLRRYAINTCRSLIFSTAIPPLNVAYTRFVFGKMRTMTEEREKLYNLSCVLKEGLEKITDRENVSCSQIVPWIIGGNGRTVNASKRLLEHGFLALPIRKPTVPAGSERIRFSLSAGLEIGEINRLVDAISATL